MSILPLPQQKTKLKLKVKERTINKIPIERVKIDKSNPNIVTDEQMHGLRESMQRFGYLSPIIIDQNNMIADGEHRLQAYKELNMKEIPAFKVDLKNDVERRLLRQTMNKLKGFHDLYKDVSELRIIEKAGELSELAQLLGQQETSLVKMLQDNPDIIANDDLDQDKELEDHLNSMKCPKCGFEW